MSKPVTPKELLEAREKFDLSSFIDHINTELLAHFTTYNWDYMTITLDAAASHFVYVKLVEIYRDVGWGVEYHDDQREGKWLEFRLGDG